MSPASKGPVAALSPFLLSAEHLRRTLTQVKANDERHQANAAALKRGDFPVVERVVAAYLALEREARRIAEDAGIEGGNLESVKRAMSLIGMSAAHDRFLAVARRALLDLKSQSHKRLRSRLAEYANQAQNRSPQLLAEIGRALSTALLVF